MEENRLKGAINDILDGLDEETLRGIHIFLYELYGTEELRERKN